jgi:TDG/mug DNA glycosylase family protein
VLLDEPLPVVDYADKQRSCSSITSASGTFIASVCGRVRSTRRSSQPRSTIFHACASEAPQLRRVCFNGQTAGKFAGWFQQQGYETRVLPSTSPAYTLAFESKLAAWRAAGLGDPGY